MLGVTFEENVGDAQADDGDDDVEEGADYGAASANSWNGAGDNILWQWFIGAEEGLAPDSFQTVEI